MTRLKKNEEEKKKKKTWKQKMKAKGLRMPK